MVSEMQSALPAGRRSELTVREAVEGDADAIGAIARASMPATYRDLCDGAVIEGILEQSYAPAALAASIRACREADDAHYLVAEGKGGVVGFLHYDRSGPEPELHRIYIDPAHQRAGVGGSLLDALHARLGAGNSYVLMVIAGNRPAVDFYFKHGFVVERRVDGPTFMHERMGVAFPAGTAPAPALVLRFNG